MTKPNDGASEFVALTLGVMLGMLREKLTDAEIINALKPAKVRAMLKVLAAREKRNG